MDELEKTLKGGFTAEEVATAKKAYHDQQMVARSQEQSLLRMIMQPRSERPHDEVGRATGGQGPGADGGADQRGLPPASRSGGAVDREGRRFQVVARKRKRTFELGKEVRAMSRERVGTVPPSRPIVPKSSARSRNTRNRRQRKAASNSGRLKALSPYCRCGHLKNVQTSLRFRPLYGAQREFCSVAYSEAAVFNPTARNRAAKSSMMH